MNRIVIATVAVLLCGATYAIAQPDAPEYSASCSGVAVASCASAEASCSAAEASCAGSVEVVAAVPVIGYRGEGPVRRIVKAPVRLIGRVAANVSERRQARIERRQSRRAARQARRLGCGG